MSDHDDDAQIMHDLAQQHHREAIEYAMKKPTPAEVAFRTWHAENVRVCMTICPHRQTWLTAYVQGQRAAWQAAAQLATEQSTERRVFDSEYGSDDKFLRIVNQATEQCCLRLAADCAARGGG